MVNKSSLAYFLLLTFLLTSQLVGNASGQQPSLKLLSEWKELEYEFPSQQARQAAVSNGEYIRGNGVPIDVDIDYSPKGRSRVFVTVPRFSTGVPITFGTLSGEVEAGGPVIRAYPDYSWHSSHGGNCDGLTSVFRVAIDECRRLWVLDTGRIGDIQHCPAQLVLFDLNTDRILHRYKFPLNQIRPGTSLFITPVVDVRDPPPSLCSNTMVYIADVTGFAIVVYDLRQNLSWRTQNKYTYPYPSSGTFTLAGESFDLMDGVFGLALSPRGYNPHSSINNNINEQSDRVLYFHALASHTENMVPLRVLDNRTMWVENPDSSPRSFVEIGTRSTQTPAKAMDRHGNLFFGLVNPIGIGCWDTSRPYKQDNLRIVAQNETTLQFASGMKVIKNMNGKEELWVLTCRFQKIMTGTISRNEVNFRIQGLQVEELLGGNKCVPIQRPNHGYHKF